MSNLKSTNALFRRKSLSLIVGVITAMILLISYLPVFASLLAERQVAQATTNSQETTTDSAVTGNNKVLVLQEAGSRIEVRTEKKLAASINSSEEGFEVHIASNQKGLAAYINATATPQAVATLIVLPPTPQVGMQEDWQAAFLENGWQNDVAGYNPAGYFKDTQGIVHLRGVLQNVLGSDAIGSNLFVLPEGYRPERKEIHAILSGESNALGRIDIFADGGVQFVAGQPDLVSLDGITFRAK